MTANTTQRVDVARLSELLEKARHALANVDDSACRCNQYWKSRGLKDPGCNCDTYDDIAALSALIDSDALPALLQQLAEAERAREEARGLLREAEPFIGWAGKPDGLMDRIADFLAANVPTHSAGGE